jgi:hypothetical protein
VRQLRRRGRKTRSAPNISLGLTPHAVCFARDQGEIGVIAVSWEGAMGGGGSSLGRLPAGLTGLTAVLNIYVAYPDLATLQHEGADVRAVRGVGDCGQDRACQTLGERRVCQSGDVLHRGIGFRLPGLFALRVDGHPALGAQDWHPQLQSNEAPASTGVPSCAWS